MKKQPTQCSTNGCASQTAPDAQRNKYPERGIIINDNVWIVKEVDAAGVHLGNEDMSLEEARSILGSDKIIGVSAHNLEEALNAQKAGVDYLGLGAMVATSTKKEAKVMDFDILVSILNRIEIPCVTL